MKRQITFACAAVCLAGTALAATRYWNPTVQNPQSSGSTTMRYFWSTPENWLDEDGSTGVPQDGDDVVFDKNIQAWAGTSAALHSLTLAKGCTTYPINQTPILLASGGDGLWYTSDQGSLTIYCTLNFRGDGDVPINIPSGKTLTVQKSYMQDTAQAYTVGAALVKRGGGMMALKDGSYWTESNSFKRTRLEEGVSQYSLVPVGSYLGNPYGLYDLIGARPEYVLDRFKDANTAAAETVDPVGPTDGTRRALRGQHCQDNHGLRYYAISAIQVENVDNLAANNYESFRFAIHLRPPQSFGGKWK